MNNTEIAIDNYSYTVTKVATKLTVRCINFELFKSATFVIGFVDNEGSLIKNEVIKIEGDEYAAWGTNDEYINTIIKQRLLGG